MTNARMSTGANANAIIDTHQGRSTANNRSLLDGSTARTYNIIESSFETAVALTAMTELLACMLATAKALAACDTTDVQTIRVSLVAFGRAAAVGTTMTTTFLHFVTQALASQLRNHFIKIVGVNVNALHLSRRCAAAARNLNRSSTGFTGAFVALERATMLTAREETIAYKIARWNRVKARFA